MQQNEQHINKPGSPAQHKEQKGEDSANHIFRNIRFLRKRNRVQAGVTLIPSPGILFRRWYSEARAAGGGLVQGRSVRHHIGAMW